MAEVVLSIEALQRLSDIRSFYRDAGEDVGERGVAALFKSYRTLIIKPDLGRPWRGSAFRREILSPFGSSGFVSLYEMSADKMEVIVLAIRHQREADYRTRVI